MHLKPISDQVVVVMGASHGIGRMAAQQFAARGAQVVVAARTASALDTLVADIEAAGGSASAIVADVTDADQVQAVAAHAVATYGRLDTWIHTAGITIYARFDQHSPAEFKRVLDVNLLGQVHGALAALPHLKQQGGALIHISSGLARRAMPLQSAYCASKHGMIGWLDALRVELQHDNMPISVTNIMPSSINTPLFGLARTKLGVRPHPIPPIYDPQLVVNALLYAAEHPVRDLVVGGGAKGLIAINSVAPSLVDWAIRHWGFAPQQTTIPQALTAPDNVDAPPYTEQRTHGEWSSETFKHSLTQWFELRPGLRKALGGAVLGALAIVSLRADR